MDVSDDAARLWDAARALNARARRDRALARTVSPVSLPPLLFVTDPERTPEPWRVAARLPRGAAVLYRHFGAPDAGATARRLREATRTAGARLLIGRDDALAEAVGADGVHLPERELERAAGLRRRRPDWLLTGAVHGVRVLGADSGLDGLILSPVFAAGGASSVRPALGVQGFAAGVRALALPVYALGGITAANVGQLADSGACGVAGVAALHSAFGSA